MGFIHCNHYNGRDLFLGETKKCRAGVDPIYSFCGGEMAGWVRKVPCLRTNETDAVCPAAEYPTREEADKREAEMREHMNRVIANITIVRPAIEKAHKESGVWSGTLECPQCSKPLHWSKAECNGHIHARCETEQCVAWME